MSVEYERIYIRFKGRVLGPMTQEKAVELIRRGQITKQHELSPDGVAWKTAEEFPSLFKSESNSPKQKVQETKIEASVPESSVQQWYANIDGANQGPVDEAVLKRWIEDGKVTADTMVWQPGMQDWISAETIRSNWFQQKSRSTGSKESRSLSADSGDIDWPGAQQKSQGQAPDLTALLVTRGWVQFLAITGLIFGTVAVIGSVAWFFLVATRDGSGPVKVIAVVVSLVAMATAIAWFFGSLFLLNYSNRLSVLKYRLTSEDIHLAMKSLNRFWKFTGIVVLIWLIVTSLLFTMIYLLGLSIPIPG